MVRLVLALAFVTSAFGFLQDKIWEALGRAQIVFFDLMLLLPAVVLGSMVWWKGRSYASRWPVILCAGLVWISLLYPGNVERNRGFLIAVLMTVPLPLAALLVEQRAWTLCAKVYVWANAAAMALIFWFESRVEHNFFAILGRFGFLAAADGSHRTGNPNQVGGQLGFAAVLAFILYLKSCEESRHKDESKFPGVYLILMIPLSIGCMLTASRGAFAAWFPAMALLFVFGTERLSPSRLRDLVGLTVAGMIVGVALMVAGQTTPWGRLQERFGDTAARGNLSGRTEIWSDALKAWQSHPDFLWRGTGIGMADDVLGQVSPMAKEDEQGVLRKNCHNAFVEWVLSLGIVGIIAMGCLAGSMIYQTVRLDGMDRNVGRSALLICAVLFAVTAVSYRHKCWPATGALCLAMLTEPVARRREQGPQSSTEDTPHHSLEGHHFQTSAVVSPVTPQDAAQPSEKHAMHQTLPRPHRPSDW